MTALVLPTKHDLAKFVKSFVSGNLEDYHGRELESVTGEKLARFND
jgi:hypothetical protein